MSAMTADDDEFNRRQYAAGLLTNSHVTELVTHWQETHPGLDRDGKAGAVQTLPSIDKARAARTKPSALRVDSDWMIGPRVTRIDAHASWYGGLLVGGGPTAIVAHYTDTDPGTAVNMARRRARKFGLDADDRAVSWHLTIDTDGSIVQMIPFHRVAWHAGGAHAQPIPGVGPANYHAVGIELVGYGKSWPEAQVATACEVWRALVQRYKIERDLAMIAHAALDPIERDDPGRLWMESYAPRVIERAYA